MLSFLRIILMIETYLMFISLVRNFSIDSGGTVSCV